MADPTAANVYDTAAWGQALAGNTQRFSQILAKYGILPDLGTLDTYHLMPSFDEGQRANILNNPESIANQLARARDYGMQASNQNANAHNALFSGAALNSVDQQKRDYATNYSNAARDELDALMGVTGDQGTAFQTIYGQLLNRPVSADTTVYPTPTAAPSNLPSVVGAPVGGRTGVPVPQGPYQRQGPEAGGKPYRPRTSTPSFSTHLRGL